MCQPYRANPKFSYKFNNLVYILPNYPVIQAYLRYEGYVRLDRRR